MTRNYWEEIVFRPGSIDLSDSHMAGVALAYDWATASRRVSIGVEAQAAIWFGDSAHLELTAMPLVLRYRMVRPLGPVHAVATGLGVSHATTVPPEERELNGQSARTMVHWMIELGVAPRSARLQPFLRLHHRSDAFGLIDTNAGSNALVLGVRRRF